MTLFRSIIDQAVPLGLSGVKLTGGEPLLHPRIREMLDLARSKNLTLVLETNGVLCSAELAERIASCGNPFVSVSLDGADNATHEWVRGVKGCFDAAIEGIRNLVRSGVRPQIIMSLMRRNKDQLEAVIRLAESLSAGSVKFNVVHPTARGEELHRTGETLTIKELVELGAWVENDLSTSTELTLLYSHPPAFCPLSRMFRQDGTGCKNCGILGILGVLSDGSYALCGIGEIVPQLVFGHAEGDRLEDVWQNAPVLIELREGLPDRLGGICGDCLMRESCLGFCIAQNYYIGRSLWDPFWYCEQAKEAGLFPESRTR